MGMAIDEINGKLWRKIYVKLQKKQLNIMYWTQQKKNNFFLQITERKNRLENFPMSLQLCSLKYKLNFN